jgi:hypothetical protein
MVAKSVTITLPPDLYDYAKRHFLRLSRVLQDRLREMMADKSEDAQEEAG